MSSIAAHIECHYYASGFKSRLFGLETRPDYLPSAESVGLRNEAVLKEGDYAVELVRRSVLDRRVTWLGIYVPAIDAVYGDRGNYCGVGVWLVECSPWNVAKLLRALLKMSRALSGSGPIASFEQDAIRFAREFLPHYLNPIAIIPHGFEGLRYAEDEYDGSDYRWAPPDDSEFGPLGEIAVSILANCYSKAGRASNRVVYFVCSAGKVSVPSASRISLMDDSALTEAFVAHLLLLSSDDIARTNQVLEDCRRLTFEREQSAKRAEDADRRVGELNDAVDALKKELADRDRAISDLRQDKGMPARHGGSKQSQGSASSRVIEDKLFEISRGVAEIRESIRRIAPDAPPQSPEQDGGTQPWWRLFNASGGTVQYLIFFIAILALMSILAWTILSTSGR